jgi:hypothetical protein
LAGENIFYEKIRQSAAQAAIQVLFGDPKLSLEDKTYNYHFFGKRFVE